MKKIESLRLDIKFWWVNLKWDTKRKYERVRYLIKRNFTFTSKIPEDEFDPSLDMDLRDMLAMTKDERDKYTLDLVKRRNTAHEVDTTEFGHP